MTSTIIPVLGFLAGILIHKYVLHKHVLLIRVELMLSFAEPTMRTPSPPQVVASSPSLADVNAPFQSTIDEYDGQLFENMGIGEMDELMNGMGAGQAGMEAVNGETQIQLLEQQESRSIAQRNSPLQIENSPTIILEKETQAQDSLRSRIEDSQYVPLEKDTQAQDSLRSRIEETQYVQLEGDTQAKEDEMVLPQNTARQDQGHPMVVPHQSTFDRSKPPPSRSAPATIVRPDVPYFTNDQAVASTMPSTSLKAPTSVPFFDRENIISQSSAPTFSFSKANIASFTQNNLKYDPRKPVKPKAPSSSESASRILSEKTQSGKLPDSAHL